MSDSQGSRKATTLSEALELMKKFGPEAEISSTFSLWKGPHISRNESEFAEWAEKGLRLSPIEEISIRWPKMG